MGGWQLVLVFLGALVVAGVLGFFAARAIMGLTRRPSHNGGESYSLPQPSVVTSAIPATSPVTSRSVKSSAQMQHDLEGYLQKRQFAAPTMAVKSKSALLIEVEANLATATAPWTGRPAAFQTRVLDADRTQLEHLPPELNEQLTEAYTDMRLANTLVWLSTDVGRRSQDLDDSYLKLCNKIALRLQSATAALRRSGT